MYVERRCYRYSIKTGKVPGFSEESLELIAASGVEGIQVMAEICQNDLDGLRMPAEWALGIAVPIFNGKVIFLTVAAVEL